MSVKLTPELLRGRLAAGHRNRWYSAFVLLNLMDIILTLYIVSRGGGEENPVGLYILVHAGWAPFITFKSLQCAIVVVLLEAIYRKRPEIGRRLIAAACGIYFALMVWDCVLLARRPI